jgi:hypothetical protein
MPVHRIPQTVPHGVRARLTQWAVVVDEQIKGMAFESKLDGPETETFESRATAEDWFDS